MVCINIWNICVLKSYAFIACNLVLLCVLTCQAEERNGGLQGSNLNKQIADIYKACKEKKAVCKGMPQNCLASDSCTYMVSVEQSPNDKYTFKVVNTEARKDSYVGVGISEDGTNMRDTSIVTCSSASAMNVFWAERPTTPKKVVNTPYFQNQEHVATNGKIYCVFDLDSSFEEHGHKFELDKKKYAILLAKGPLKETDANGVNIGYHSADRIRFESMKLTSSKGNSSSSIFFMSYIITFSLIVINWLN